ncbi:hypothetical protein CMI47_07125 [Candidatus Pacearchaeota archaeon]|nr:hypothetical protein [Candidatus Pacearchaeota archaeon]|tara:strand:- start:307 stop:507 length:201 start_codon:yes stop_codon:yes gene_type:complete
MRKYCVEQERTLMGKTVTTRRLFDDRTAAKKFAREIRANGKVQLFSYDGSKFETIKSLPDKKALRI